MQIAITRLLRHPLKLSVLFASVVFAAALGCDAGARAEEYPSRPIHLIVTYPAGGVADLAARAVSQPLGEILGQQIVVENRPGASGTLGASDVARANPDGYTLLLTPGDFIVMPSLAPQMSFDPNKDLIPIAMVSSNPLVVGANIDAPFNNVAELIKAAKAQPGKIAYGTPGTGSSDHVAGAWMAIEAHIDLMQVPYRGGPATANGVATGEVPLGVVSPPSIRPLIDAGKVKVIALTGKNRPQALPKSWPTLYESGLPVDAILWNGIFAPAGTPPAIVKKLEDALIKTQADPRVRVRLNTAGIDVEAVIGPAFAELIKNETTRYTEIIKQTGIKVEH
jgi:tripartite-type tricarboxylate transporter receptor subunit TctC